MHLYIIIYSNIIDYIWKQNIEIYICKSCYIYLNPRKFILKRKIFRCDSAMGLVEYYHLVLSFCPRCNQGIMHSLSLSKSNSLINYLLSCGLHLKVKTVLVYSLNLVCPLGAHGKLKSVWVFKIITNGFHSLPASSLVWIHLVHLPYQWHTHISIPSLHTPAYSS